MPKIAIIGSNGQLGSDSVEVFRSGGYDVTEVNHDRLEVADDGAVGDLFRGEAPDIVLNTAAFHNVEGCERDPEAAFRVNALGARNLGRAAAALGCRLIHVSTDYVFNGAKSTPYGEDDLPAPLNVYGASKLSGEHLMLAEHPAAAVVRTSGLYGRVPCRAKQGGLNFVQLMLQLARERGTVKVVTDEFVTPTHTLDLARQLLALAESDLSGVVHATAAGGCSWFEFAEAIFALGDVSVRLEPTTAEAFPTKVRRPSYSVLDNGRLRDAGIDRMPPWKESLASYMEAIGVRRGTGSDRF